MLFDPREICYLKKPKSFPEVTPPLGSVTSVVCGFKSRRPHQENGCFSSEKVRKTAVSFLAGVVASVKLDFFFVFCDFLPQLSNLSLYAWHLLIQLSA